MSEGGNQDTDTDVGPVTDSATSTGADGGTAAAVSPITGFEYTPMPTAFMAATRKE